MGKIRVLSDQVASQVAAGEVVERPASLVKELVENSLDAGATRVWVEYVRGGSRLVSVRDDGHGMDREDALLCLERHATSKIRTGTDLSTVRTMGFRGEALPSIASVSRFRLITREPQAESGTEITVEGGRVESVKEAGGPVGTLIEVKELFYNLPARRKFLRGEETESAHIVHGMQGMALASPGVAFDCRRDGKPVLALPRAESLAVRIRDLFGQDYLDRLAEINPMEGEGFRVSGFLARPGQGRRDRLQQIVILNGRPIVCPAVQQPLREAYAEALPRGEHPLAVLIIEMDPELVDCNVHPAKREVRLRQPDALRRGVFDAARAVIVQSRERMAAALPRPVAPPPAPVFAARQPQQTFTLPVVPPKALASPPVSRIPLPERGEVPPAASPEVAAPDPASEETSVEAEEAQATPVELPPVVGTAEAVPEPEPDRFRYVGVLGEKYFMLESEEGLVLLDPRAAAERILFEGLVRQIESGEAPSQRLLMPVIAELPAREHAWVADHLDELRSAGFGLEPFGGETLKIEALPAFAADRNPQQLLHDLAAAMRAAGRLPRGKGLREMLARSVSRLAAGERVRDDEDRARRIVRELLACELPYASPAGRPTMIQFSHAELDRKFGRNN